MKPTVAAAAALLAALSLAAPSPAFNYPGVPQAPDMCGPGSFYTDATGALWGPSHNVYPPFPPFQGMLGVPNGGGPGGFGGPFGPGGPFARFAFPTHPFARSPRDYFMMECTPPDVYPGASTAVPGYDTRTTPVPPPPPDGEPVRPLPPPDRGGTGVPPVRPLPPPDGGGPP
jgi:hypothetical protein